jgi:hypothetical protein
MFIFVVSRGVVKKTGALDGFDRPITALADTLNDLLSGRTAFFSWRSLLMGAIFFIGQRHGAGKANPDSIFWCKANVSRRISNECGSSRIDLPGTTPHWPFI